MSIPKKIPKSVIKSLTKNAQVAQMKEALGKFMSRIQNSRTASPNLSAPSFTPEQEASINDFIIANKEANNPRMIARSDNTRVSQMQSDIANSLDKDINSLTESDIKLYNDTKALEGISGSMGEKGMPEWATKRYNERGEETEEYKDLKKIDPETLRGFLDFKHGGPVKNVGWNEAKGMGGMTSAFRHDWGSKK